MRIVLGIIAGIFVAFLSIAGIEWIGARLHPLPPEINLRDPPAMAGVPLSFFLPVLLAWFVGSLAGTAVALRIGRHRLASWAVPALIMLGVIANLMMIPHPGWMWFAGLAATLVGGLLAQRLIRTPGTAATMS